jgi:hypothetical protein
MGRFGKRARESTRQPWTIQQVMVGIEPILTTAGDFTRFKSGAKDVQFNDAYPPGRMVTCRVFDHDGEEAEVQLTVDRVRKTLRAAWPQARFGYTVYFREFAALGLPGAFPLTGHRTLVAIELTSAGLALVDHGTDTPRTVAWSDFTFSNGPELRLLMNGSTTDISPPQTPEYRLLEELLTKFGHFKQLHF